MFRKALGVLTIFAILANQAVAVVSHSHGDHSERASRPHIHLNGHDHSHGHEHGHSHLHGHDHRSDGAGNNDSVTSTPSHDSDAVFVVESDSNFSSEHRSVESLGSVESPATVNTLDVLDWSNCRVPSDTRFTKHSSMPSPLAHALILKKIRLLL